jgi:hypothetical protein
VGSVHLFTEKKKRVPLQELPVVSALCPLGTGEQVQLIVSPSTIERFVSARRITDLFQAWAHLVGEMPPVNNAELVRRTEHPNDRIAALCDAHACFKGVKRRYDQDDDGKEIYVYVIATPYTVRWQSSLCTVAGVFPATDATVLTVQVKPRSALQDCDEGIWGAIVKWEFVNADRERPDLPDGFDERYDMLVWQR